MKLKDSSPYSKSYYRDDGACYNQHIVPRFVLSNFSYEYGRRLFAKKSHLYELNSSGDIISRHTYSDEFTHRLLYSSVLDDSWSYYEQPAYDMINKLLYGVEYTVNYAELSSSIFPYMAGLVARDSNLYRKLSRTSFAQIRPWVGIDTLRILVMEMMLTALNYATITVVRNKNRSFVLPENGYTFVSNGLTKYMLAPISSSMALKALWEPVNHISHVKMRNLDRNEYIISDRLEQSRAIDGSSYVLSDSKEVLEDMKSHKLLPFYLEKHDYTASYNIVQWVFHWMSEYHLRDWAHFRYKYLYGHYDTYDMNDKQQVSDLFNDIKSLHSWLPPVIIVPSHDSGFSFSNDKPFESMKSHGVQVGWRQPKNIRFDVYDNIRSGNSITTLD